MVNSTVLTHGAQNTVMRQDAQTSSLPPSTFSGMPVEVIGQCLDYLPLNDWPNVMQVNRLCGRLIQGMLSDFRYSIQKGQAQFIRIGEEGEHNTEHNVSYMPMPADLPREIKKFMKGTIGIETLPDELVLHIFGFLSWANQGRASFVCRQWQNIAADPTLLTTSYLKERYPLMQVLDEKICKTHFGALGLDFEHAPPLEPRMISVLHRLNGSLKIEGNAGITLTYLPPGLTFNMLRQAYPDKFRFVWDRISTEFGDIPAEGGWFALTNNVVEGSRGLPMSEQQELVKTMGCDIPGLLEVTSVAILTYMNSPAESPTRLYPVGTFSRVSQQIDGYPLAVGGFAPAGLRVDDYFALGFGGFGALRKF